MSSELSYDNTAYLAAWENDNNLRKISKTAFAKASHTHNYLPLSGGTLTGAVTCNSTITFGKSDNYGIRTSVDTYCTIGTSDKRFYESYIDRMHGTCICLTSDGSLTSTSYNGELVCGELTANRTYYLPNKGGTIALTNDLKINGDSSYSSGTYIYAPTSAGTTDYILQSNGSGAPEWRTPGLKLVKAGTINAPQSVGQYSGDFVTLPDGSSTGNCGFIIITWAWTVAAAIDIFTAMHTSYNSSIQHFGNSNAKVELSSNKLCIWNGETNGSMFYLVYQIIRTNYNS